ncbi:MAG: M16 family metallopeptidase [Elusimicrobiota bacterium]
MKRRIFFGLLSSLLFFFSFFIPCFAHANPFETIVKKVEKITLKNGMRVLLVERPDSPSISFTTYIRTGGVDDEMGFSGLAHMFEHMLFKGTKTIGTRDYQKEKKILDAMDLVQEKILLEKSQKVPNQQILAQYSAEFKKLEEAHESVLIRQEFWQIYEQAGGEGLNASTGYDFTNYRVTLPKNQLKLWMIMESDRILNPVLREFYKERDVIMEERRQRTEASPQGKLWEQFLAAAYIAHPYGRPIVGWESDIHRMLRRDAELFFSKHYDISRFVLVIVGGFESAQVKTYLKQYFETIPSRSSLLNNRDLIPVEPPQEGERRAKVFYDAEPSVLIGFHVPSIGHADAAPLYILGELFDQGRFSLFYRNLVEKKKVAASVWAGSTAPGDRYPSLFTIGGSPRFPYTNADLEKAIYEEIENLKKTGASLADLNRVKNNIEASLVRDLVSDSGLADNLGIFECLAEDWNTLFHFINKLREVTPQDVSRVLSTYLIEKNRTVATLEREKK